MGEELGAVLAQLRDIQEPSLLTWPYPIGWWLLMLSVLATVVFLSIWWGKRVLKDRPYRDLRAVALELQQRFKENQLTESVYVNTVNRLCKHLLVDIEAIPDAKRADGHVWLSVLADRFNDDRFVEGVGQLLGSSRYRRNSEFDSQLVDLIDESLCTVKPVKN